MRVLSVCGSLQAASTNLALLKAVARLAPETMVVTLSDELRLLPHFNPDLEQQGVPPEVQQWRGALATNDVVLFASPEYGHSLPGALKNGIDWLIGSGELNQKPVALTCAVKSLARGTQGLDALEKTLLAVEAKIIWKRAIEVNEGLETNLQPLLLAMDFDRRSTEPVIRSLDTLTQKRNAR
jgi:chromate reductase, NAD(P)H dehydrogenase (quinone)